MVKITHLLFDCDNTLVLSEDLAFEACADVLNSVLAEKGATQRYTGPDLIQEFIGQNFRGMLGTLSDRYKWEIPDAEVERLVKEEENKVIEKLEAKAQPCVNSTEVLEKLANEKKYSLAVVSSSAKRRVLASIKKVGQDKYFSDDVVFSAATSLNPPTSKPNPAIYIHACKVLNAEPGQSIAVEDSKSGTKSAVAAGIPTIAYVGSYETPEKQKEVADALLAEGAKVVMYDWKEFKDKVAEIEKLEKL